MADTILDAIVVGGGPAGLAAALWLGRYRKRTLLVDADDARSKPVVASHGYLGADGISPAELRERAKADLKRYSTVEHLAGSVSHARREGDVFALTIDDAEHRTRSVILATGVRDRFPLIANLGEHLGRSVFTCPSCDGYETEGKHVAVFGWDEETVAFAEHLLEWARSVVIVTDGPRFEGRVPPSEPIAVIEADATELVGGDGVLRGVKLADGRVIDVDVAFVAIDQEANTELADELGCDRTAEGCVAVNEHNRTCIDGVYAAGDIAGGPQLIQVAAASGTVAGIRCATWLGRG